MATSTSIALRTKHGRLFTWGRRIILLLVATVIVLAICGASYQAIENAADARHFHQEGRFINVGGHRLSIDCTGQGSPTVVLDTGLGVPAIGWKSVQSDVSKFTRVCSYDRAGYGYSDAGPMPRTSAQIVQELHALLQNAGEHPPYVLVGHSFGGFNVRVYNGRYPSEVAGMILVDVRRKTRTN